MVSVHSFRFLLQAANGAQTDPLPLGLHGNFPSVGRFFCGSGVFWVKLERLSEKLFVIDQLGRMSSKVFLGMDSSRFTPLDLS